MFDLKSRLMPLVYLLILAAAIWVVYRVFTYGLEKGMFTGRYYPPAETLKTRPGQGEGEQVYLLDLLDPTEELLASGRQLYQLNCASCHGSTGRGDGPRSAGLNPPARDFTNQEFKFGASSLQIYNTLTSGSPGTSMAAFNFLTVTERMAMSHYVRSLVPSPPDNPPELVESLPRPPGAVSAAPQQESPEADIGADSAAISGIMKPAVSEGLPLDFAARLLIDQEERMRPGVAGVARPIESPVYAVSCAGCHGLRGEGMTVSAPVAGSGRIYYRTVPLSHAGGTYLGNEEAFGEFLSSGIPGLNGHRFSNLSREKVNELYLMLLSLTNR